MVLRRKGKEKCMTTEQRLAHLETKCNRLTLTLTGIMMLAVVIICVAAKPNEIKDSVVAGFQWATKEVGTLKI